jgi:thioredoxin 1
MSNIINVDAKNYEEEVLNSKIPVVVDFWAEWCGPCKMMMPLLDESSDKYDGQVKFVKINVDEGSALAAKHSVRGIPTVIIFENGKQKDTKVGAMSKVELDLFVKDNI